LNRIGKLPTNPIKDEDSLVENELTCTFFDPILSRLISDPVKDVHLRWSDIIAPKTPRQRPDAVISKVNQLSFGQSLGFGEARVQHASNYELCHDLLRLALYSKDSIDMNYLDGCMLFQVHGFGITFYLTQLLHEHVYTMLKVCSSLRSLADCV
ncbi:hypothetical protein DM01DRAFT_262919, partial [Hesseltinella vesiculosa]